MAGSDSRALYFQFVSFYHVVQVILMRVVVDTNVFVGAALSAKSLPAPAVYTGDFSLTRIDNLST